MRIELSLPWRGGGIHFYRGADAKPAAHNWDFSIPTASGEAPGIITWTHSKLWATRRIIFHRERPPKNREGNMKMARTSSNTPTTAKPRSRKGSKISQTMGYKINTSRARGQQITSRMHQSRKVITYQIRIFGAWSFDFSECRAEIATPR